MAEILLSPVGMLFERLGSAAIKTLARYAGILSEVKNWEASLSEIQEVLDDASEKETTNTHIKRWLNRLQHLAYDIDDILDDLATDAMHREVAEETGAITSKVRKLLPTSFSLGIRMHAKLNSIRTRLQALEKDRVDLGLNKVRKGKIVMNRSTESRFLRVPNIIGRQDEKKALLCKLLGDKTCEQNFNIVPIVGMGGIGKTTLARLLYNETLVKDHFEIRAWVCVSDEFDIRKISTSIFEEVTGGHKEFVNFNSLQEALQKELIGKRFLLVLDDVWSETRKDWDTLVSPFDAGASGSKIIVTTRKEKLLNSLGYHNLNHVQLLSYDDSLSLFSQHALGESNLDSHPKLKQYGEGIVKKCGGLPLALEAIGTLLSSKPEPREEEWKDVLDSEIWTLKDEKEVVPAALRLSYNDLGAHLKKLFAYCSLFPKDYMFDKKELILLWIAEGFLHQSSKSTVERLGDNCFEELLSRSFFQRAPNKESSFVMHDLMNDLATSVAGDFFWRLEGEVKEDVTMEKCRHMSFVCEEYMGYKKFEAFERAKNLRTFLAVSVRADERWHAFYISSKILGDLLHNFPLLRVLSLSYLQITEVPKSIGSLKHLRYLNLCQTAITCLPENVCNLYNLETLIVSSCRQLTNLPINFSNLKKLRHFDISDTPLVKKLPLGLGELESLQTLSKIIIGGDNDFAITKLKDLNNLDGVISIEGLDKVQDVTHARGENLLQMRLSVLNVEWSDVADGSRKEALEKEVLNVLKPHYDDSLKRLSIVSYGGIEFPNWVGDHTFCNLTEVSIRGCKKCTSLPPLGQLPSLKELVIQGMDGVKVVELQRLAFPSLETLSLYDMKGWEVWSSNGDTVFPCLEKLCLNGCPNLVEISLGPLPWVKVLKIDGCSDGVLRSLVHVASSVTELEICGISGLTDELWGGVMEHLGAVEKIEIESCDEIRYLWESEARAGKVLVNLRKLIIRTCDNLVSLGGKEEDCCGSKLTSLKTLEVRFCKSIEHCSCPNSIESLDINDCGSLTSVSFPTEGQKQLKSVVIVGCEKLLEKDFRSEGTINASMWMLQTVHITNWSNLKSVIQLSCFIHLKQLAISDCPGLESFPDQELSNLISLEFLEISNCPCMDASFPRGLWPPNLSHLVIGGLKKPMSEWGPQNFPTSLVTLDLSSSGPGDVSRCDQLTPILPSSLTTLHIQNFEKLRSLSRGLQHLTSLEHLHIVNCPKMNHLPVKLLPSLLSLDICGSPKLEERCTRRGSYWPRISHIPDIYISDMRN